RGSGRSQSLFGQWKGLCHAGANFDCGWWLVFKVGAIGWKSKITLEFTLFALKMGSYSALKKREALINIGMIYLEAVSN
ncbi:hypothetical protein QIH53_27195, partial [Klebsiella pneumoniae]|nr:hypothetical protein [Klebsiella pneumoniae]